MDVGMDSAFYLKGRYEPFSIDEIMKIMDKGTIMVVDHHKPEKE